MPLPFAPLLGLILGIALAWAGRDDLKKDKGPLIASRAVAVAAAAGFLLLAPIAGYFAVFHADWAYLYLAPRSRVPSAVDLALVILAGAAVPLGVALAAEAARQRNRDLVLWLGLTPTVVVGALALACARRLAVSATYAQYHGDYGKLPILASSLGHGVLWMTFVLALGVAWSVRALRPRAAPGNRARS